MPTDPEDPGISRRTLLKAGVAVGAAGLAGVGGFVLIRSLVPGDTEEPTVLPGRFTYVRPVGVETTPWWEEAGLVGEEARLSHFDLGRGASALWHPMGPGGEDIVSGAGLPALLMRMGEEQLTFPAGYPREKFVVDGLYAVFNLCTHAGCRPGWQLVPRESYPHDLGFETIFCQCHCAQFHPREIVEDRHPLDTDGSGARYVGVRAVAGPVDRAMPLIPLEVVDDVLVGHMEDPDWYRYLDFRNAFDG